MIPTMQFSMSLPDQLVKSDALHNKYMKAALEKVALDHWKNRLKKHFAPDAKRRYNYAKRANSTIARKIKKGRGNVDLVDSGDSRREMLSHYKLTKGGGGMTEQGTRRAIVVKLFVRFAFKGGSGRLRKTESRQAVTIAQLRREVAVVTDSEIKEIAEAAKRHYVMLVNTTKKSQRVGEFMNVLMEGPSL